MKSFLVSVIAIVALISHGLVAPARADAPPASGDQKIRVLLTFGGHGFEEARFFAMFDNLKNVQTTKAPLPQSVGLLKPGLEKNFDVIVMYDMAAKMSPEEEKNLVDLLRRGIGLVSLHHNLCSRQNSDAFRRIIGGQYCYGVSEGSGKNAHLLPNEIDGKKYGPTNYLHDQDMEIKVADKEHPITRGLADFKIHDETYSNYYVAPDVHVLLTANHPKQNPQIAWVKEYGKSRVFYFQLGHDSQAWNHPSYRQILTRGIQWAARR